MATVAEIGIRRTEPGESRVRAIRRWAESHYGLVSRRKLRDLGVSDDQVDWLLRCGWLVPARSGVFFVGHRSGVAGQREAIELAAAGPGAALAGPSAAAWLRMTEPWRGPVHLVAPRARACRDAHVVRHCDAVAPAELVVVRGLACVAPQRAVMDLPAARLRQALQWLMRNAIAIEPIVERMRGRRGARAFRAEVEQLIPQLAHTMSELEARFVRLCRRHGLPAPVVNGLLANGDLIDIAWPGSRVVVELDGRRWHEHRDREDRERDHRRLLEGRVTFRFGWSDVTRDAAATASKLRRGLELW